MIVAPSVVVRAIRQTSYLTCLNCGALAFNWHNYFAASVLLSLDGWKDVYQLFPAPLGGGGQVLPGFLGGSKTALDIYAKLLVPSPASI